MEIGSDKRTALLALAAASLAAWAAAIIALITDLAFVYDEVPSLFLSASLNYTELANVVIIAAVSLALSFFLTPLALFIESFLLRAARVDGLATYALLPTCCGFAALAFAPPWMNTLIFIVSSAVSTAGGVWWIGKRSSNDRDAARRQMRSALWLTGGMLSLAALLLGAGFVRGSQAEATSLKESEGAPQLGRRLVGGIATARTLFLYNSEGKLVAFDRANWRPTVLADRDIIDIKQRGGSIWVLSASGQSAQYNDGRWQPAEAGVFAVSAYRNGQLVASTPVTYSEGDRPVAFLLRRSGPVVLSSGAVYLGNEDGSAWTRRSYRQPFKELPDSGVAVATPAGDESSVYIGFNKGEWGGGVRVVDVETGQIRTIERRDSPALCAGPLDSDCDPVTGLVSDPARVDCVLASVGLSHMMEHGRILRICGARVEVLAERPVETMSSWLARHSRWLVGRAPEEPQSTEATFGLVRGKGETVWAVTRQRLYHIHLSTVHAVDQPQFENHSGLMVAELPEVMLVTTDRNAAQSLSGITPMIIPVN